MKANKAPEKLYLHPTAKGNVGASWLVFPLTDNDIEYTRTDAIIEKVCEWLRNNSYTYANNALGKEYLVNDFKNYMEGE